MKIFFDMDGVLADFNKGLRGLCGTEPMEQGEYDPKKDDMIWDAVRRTDHFYDRLEAVPGSLELFNRLYEKFGDDCQILSAIPRPERKIPTAGDDKRNWVRRLLSPEIKVNIVLRKEKPNYCTGPACILIDDYAKNIREWEGLRGTGILFVSAEDTEKKLKERGVL